MENLLSQLKLKTPNCLADFTTFYVNKHKAFSEQCQLNQMPASMLIGLIFEYMNENSIDFSVSDINLDTLNSEILVVLIQFEETIKHYS